MPDQSEGRDDSPACNLKTTYSAETSTLLVRSSPSRSFVFALIVRFAGLFCVFAMALIMASHRPTVPIVAMAVVLALLVVFCAVHLVQSLMVRSFEFSGRLREFTYLVTPWKKGSISFDRIEKIEIVIGSTGVLQAAWLRLSAAGQKKAFDVGCVSKRGATESQLIEALSPIADQISIVVGSAWTRERVTTRPPPGM